MNYRYHIVLGDQFVLMRWPEGIDQDAFMDALDKKLNNCHTAVDFSIVGDLVPTDDPLENVKYTLQYLQEAFDGGYDHLPQFALWDYRGGQFVTVNGEGKDGLQYR